jgi:hypothetical protein
MSQKRIVEADYYASLVQKAWKGFAQQKKWSLIRVKWETLISLKRAANLAATSGSGGDAGGASNKWEALISLKRAANLAAANTSSGDDAGDVSGINAKTTPTVIHPAPPAFLDNPTLPSLVADDDCPQLEVARGLDALSSAVSVYIDDPSGNADSFQETFQAWIDDEEITNCVEFAKACGYNVDSETFEPQLSLETAHALQDAVAACRTSMGIAT